MNSARTSKRTLHFTVTTSNINSLILFKEIITVYTQNRKVPQIQKVELLSVKSRWDIVLIGL
jgi:hypothetical protein